MALNLGGVGQQDKKEEGQEDLLAEHPLRRQASRRQNEGLMGDSRLGAQKEPVRGEESLSLVKRHDGGLD